MANNSTAITEEIVVGGEAFTWTLAPDDVTPRSHAVRFSHTVALGLVPSPDGVSTFRISSCCDGLLVFKKPRRGRGDQVICALCLAPEDEIRGDARSAMGVATTFDALLTCVEESARGERRDPVLKEILGGWARTSLAPHLERLARREGWFNSPLKR